MRTSSAAQQLYLDALISYPRTSSQKLPPSIGYEKILIDLSKNSEYSFLARKLVAKSPLKPTEGKKQDLAHPAIYPTGKVPKRDLVGAEKNIYNLVVCRFMAVFGEPTTRQTVKVMLNINGQRFFLNGQQTLDKGWLCFYEGFVRPQDRSLPSIAEGENVRIQRVAIENKFTNPPPRYNPGSLLKKMEQGNIGTKATRASTMQTLYDREYIRGERIVVTELGLAVMEVLRAFCPNVVSVEFTRQLEEKMSWVQQRKDTKQKILQEAIGILKPLLSNLKNNEGKVGKQLSTAVSQAKLEKITIGPCPMCHTGKLIIQHSKKTDKRFVGCTNFFKGVCRAAFPLPQKGKVKPSSKNCGTCGWSTVLVWFKGRHLWNLCFNPGCPSKKTSEEKV
jgi:DNA topoisomerase-1